MRDPTGDGERMEDFVEAERFRAGVRPFEAVDEGADGVEETSCD